MKLLSLRQIRTIGLLFCAVILVACSSTIPQSPQSAAPQDMPRPAATTRMESSSTPSLTPVTPTLTPTLVPSPLPSITSTPQPQPISFSNAAKLQIIREFQNSDQMAQLFSRAISPDAHLLALAGCLEEGANNQCQNKTFFRLFDVNTGETLRDLEYLSPAIQILAFSPDGKVLAAAGCDITLAIYGLSDTICDLPRVWLVSTENGKVITELKGYNSHVTDFAFSQDSSTLYTSVVYDRFRGDGDHVIRVYNARTGEKLTTIETGMITCTEMYLGMSPDGRYLVANVVSPCDSQSFVAWWDVQDPTHPRQVAHADSFSDFRVSPDSTQVLLHNRKDNTIMLYDLVAGHSIKLIPNVPWQSLFNTFDYLFDRNTIILDVSREYDIVDLTSGKVIHRILPRPGDQYMGGYLLFPDRRTMLVFPVSDSTAADILDLTTWQSIPLQSDPNQTASWLSSSFLIFTPDGTRLLNISCDLGAPHIQVWGFKDPVQEQAGQALGHYFDLLSSGDYSQAAQMFIPYAEVSSEALGKVVLYESFPADYLQKLVPEVQVSDPKALLTVLCQDQTFPCRPVREVVYQSQVGDSLYRFVVTFAGPDGAVAGWPLCRNVPASQWCDHRHGDFTFYVLHKPDGSFGVVDGFPPALELRVKY